MNYDFDTVVDRRNTGSLKWDVKDGELPMWVADMDFMTAPEIREALLDRVKHGVFGYNVVTRDWYDAIEHWWDKRHGFKIEDEWLIFCTGVVPAISSIVRKLTDVGDNVLIQPPVYNIFYNSVLNNGRKVLECPLVFDKHRYYIDFEDLESKLSLQKTTLMILCNPHNPIGKIWDAQTLAKIGELCEKYNVTVVSDEIHCDLTDPGKSYVPFASVSEVCRDISVTCMAPTKAFNIAGIQCAAVCAPNAKLRSLVDRGLNTDEVAEPNSFAITATVAAFTRGEKWLDALRQYIFENKKTATEFLNVNLPCVKPVLSEATYLMWLDCSEVSPDASKLADFARERTGLYVCSGEQYGISGKSFLRLNVACPKSVLVDGLNRLREAVLSYTE